MKIEMGKKETADSLTRKGERALLQSLNRLKTDNSEVYAQFRKRNPELSDAITKYCTVYKKMKKVEDDGVLEEFSLASKKLIRAFRFTDAAKDYEFVSDNFIDVLGSPLYLSLETIFDVSLFKEKGKMRMFKNTYTLSRTIRQVSSDSFIFFVKPYFYYVNATTGKILRRIDLKVYNFDSEKYLYIDGLDHIYYGKEVIYTYLDGLFGKWEVATYLKRSGNKKSGTLYEYVNFTTKKTRAEHGGHNFYLPAHHVVMICWYGLNAVKFCMGSGSLLTVDHMNGDSLDNCIMNLAILTRVANAKQAKSGVKGINFIQFFEVCGYCAAPFSYKYYI